MMEKTLPEVCTIQYGFPFDSSKFCSAEGVPLVRIRDVVRGYSETYTTETAGENYIVKDGDLLIGMDGEFNIAYWKGGRAYLNQRVCRLIPREDVDRDYIFYYMPKALKAIEDATPFVTVKHLSAKQLSKILIPLPDMKEQQRISAVLRSVDRVIAMRQKELDELNNLVKSRFIELFGMPGTDAFGWGLVPLGSTCNINPKKSLDSRLVSGAVVSFVPMPAVTEHGEIDATAIKEYDEVKTGFTYFAENDVLFAKITPCMENGKGAVAKGLHNGIGFGSTEFHVLRPISGKTDPYWIYTLTAFSQFRMDAASNMTGSAGQRRVPASFLENYRVSLPPIALQEQFAAFVEQTDKSKLCGKMEVAA
mgnify:CR=1 FL=1